VEQRYGRVQQGEGRLRSRRGVHASHGEQGQLAHRWPGLRWRQTPVLHFIEKLRAKVQPVIQVSEPVHRHGLQQNAVRKLMQPFFRKLRVNDTGDAQLVKTTGHKAEIIKHFTAYVFH